MPLWIAAAHAAPLDDAMTDGRPVIVLVDRGDGAQFGVWLDQATGAARARVDAVALVLATPDELSAWLGAPLPTTADLVRIDPLGRVAAHQDVGPIAWTREETADTEDTNEDSPWAPLRPGASARWGDSIAPVQPSMYATLPSTPPTVPSAKYGQGQQPVPQFEVDRQVDAIVRAFDASLQRLLRRVPLPTAGPGRAVSDPSTSAPSVTRPEVYGAVWCASAGCGAACDLPPEYVTLPPDAAHPEARTVEVVDLGPSCGMGYIPADIATFLQRWNG